MNRSTPSIEEKNILKSEAIRKWWPTTQSLDLVEGSSQQVAKAVKLEVHRFLKGESLSESWENFPTIDEAFSAVGTFANVPTVFLVLPTKSRWSVLWNNSFLCSGYDSLCACLTKNHHLTTLHWSAHDETTTFQPGARFIHRRFHDGVVEKRSVHVAREDARWRFFESGQPLIEEDVLGYNERLKRHRLNERKMSDLLSRLGARPWLEEFYGVDTEATFVLRRRKTPVSVDVRLASEVLIADTKNISE